MPKISKMYSPNWTQVYMSNTDCDYNNITRVIELFNFTHVVISIDSVSSDSEIFKLSDELGLERIINPTSEESFELSVSVPMDLLNRILEKAIAEDPENIFITHAVDPMVWKQHVRIHPSTLLSKSITDVFIGVERDKQIISISTAKDIYTPRDLIKALKAKFEIKIKTKEHSL